MPNWCANTVTMKGLSEVLRKDENGNPTFSFNDIIPMPESLKVTSGSSNDLDIMVYMTEKFEIPYLNLDPEKQEFLRKYINNPFSKDWVAEVWNRCQKIDKDKLDEAYEAGKILVENIKNHGYPTWYEWCINTWGTKWDVGSDDLCIDGDTMQFNTAWSPPFGVLLEMSAQHPNVEITCDWQEEGGYEGMLAFLNGECTMDESREWCWDDEESDDIEVE